MEEEYVSLSDIRKEVGCSIKELNAMLRKLKVGEFKYRNKRHVDASDAKRIIKEFSLPEQLQIRTTWAQFLAPAKNKQYIYATVKGYPGKHLIKIPLRLARIGKSGAHVLAKKKIEVEIIEDKDGVSFRHIDFIKRGFIRG